jgi:cytochrome c oxidase subunit IV
MSVEGGHAAGAHERSHPTVRQYLLIGLLLTLITVVELVASYADLGSLLIPILVVLSAVKFAVVLAYFMHLRFEDALLTRFFVFGFVLAGALLVALIALFWTDGSIANR